MKSEFLKLNLNDVGKGLIVAFITALLTGFYQIIQSNGVIDWGTVKPILLTSIGAAISYLLKNYFTNSKDNILQKEVK